MPCSGRTQRRLSVRGEASPQRIDLGQGKRGRSRGSPRRARSAVARPGLSITANQMPSRSSSWSCVRPVLRRKPSSACGGARLRGPLISSLTASVASGRPRAISASRRGVDQMVIDRRPRDPPPPAARANSRARSARALACIRAGISSEQQFEQEIGHSVHAGCFAVQRSDWLSIHACAGCPSPGRGRGRYRPGASGDRDHAARLQQVEDVAGLDRLLIGRRSARSPSRQFSAFGLGRLANSVEQALGVGDLEIPLRHLLLILEEHVAIGHARHVVEGRGRNTLSTPWMYIASRSSP